jgi:hypothetical protein
MCGKNFSLRIKHIAYPVNAGRDALSRILTYCLFLGSRAVREQLAIAFTIRPSIFQERRKRALLASNPPRNKKIKTTRADESLSCIVPDRPNRIGHEDQIDRFMCFGKRGWLSERIKVMLRGQIYSWANMLLHQMVTKMP